MYRIWLRRMFPRSASKVSSIRRSTIQPRLLQLEDRDNPVVISIATPASQLEGNVGTSTMTFTVSLDAPAPAGGVKVDFATSDGSAVAPTDYVTNSGTLTFNAGDTSKTFSVTINGDTVVEADETFTVSLSNPSVGDTIGVGAGTATGTITNDDKTTLTVSSVSQLEGAGTMTFNVTSSNAVQGGFKVDYATANGTATIADNDYAAATGTLTFVGNVGETQSFTVTVNTDTKVEADETFTIGLSNVVPTDVLIATSNFDTSSVGTGTIQNDDTTTLTIANVSQLENAGGMTFTVTSSNAVQGGFTVQYATADGTATVADNDYAAATGTLTFSGNAGETQTFTVTITNDGKVEADETFGVSLNTPAALGAGVAASNILATGTATGTIQNDDKTTLSIANVSQLEGAGTMTFTVTSSNAVVGGFKVDYATADGTATIADTDYNAASGTLTFTGNAGETQTFTVTINNDANVEADENFGVSLSNPLALGAGVATANILATGTATGTIQNDDKTTLTVSNVSQLENVGTMTFTVTSSNVVVGGFKVDYATIAGTATSGVDYALASGTLTFAGTAGESQSFTVTINNDTVVEADETFTIGLNNIAPTNPAISKSSAFGTTTGTGTIQNEDNTAVTVANVTQAENGGPMTFTVTLADAVEGGFKLNYSITDITTTGADYTVPGSFVTFVGNAGETQTFTVNPVNDSIIEPDETFKVSLGPVTPTNPSVNAANIVATSTATGTIVNDDKTTLSIANVSQFEATGTMTFTVTSSNAVQGGFKIDFATADGTATVANNDYTANSGTLTFVGTAGETQSFLVSILDNNVVELDETFTAALNNVTPTDATIAKSTFLVPAPATGTIQNDDNAVISISPATITEGGNLVFTVSLSNPVDVPVTLDASTLDITATGGARYNAFANQLITFPALNTNQTVTVSTIDDRRVQGTQTMSVNLTNLAASGRSVSIGTPSAIGSIVDNDTATFSYSVATQSLLEDNATVSANIVLTLNTVGAGTIGIDQTEVVSVGNGGTAVLGPVVAGNYQFATPTVFTFGPGNGITFTQTVSVAIQENLTDEGDKTITLPLSITSDGTGGQVSLGAIPTHTVTILNDDNPVRTYDATVAGAYRIVRNGAFVDLFVNSNLIARDLFGTTPILLNGTSSTDTFQVDFSGGNPIPAGGITFNGNGPATSVGDAISFTGGTFTQITHTYTSGSSGMLDFTGFGVVNYTNVEEPVQLAVTSVATLNFVLPAGPSSAVLEEDAGGTGNNTAQLRSTGGTFLPTVFTAPTSLLTLTRGNAADTVTINQLVDVTSSITVGSVVAPFANITQAGSVSSNGVVNEFANIIAVNATLNVATSVNLVAGTTATQTAAITTPNLILGTAGNIGTYTLTNAGNNAQNLSATTSGSVSYTDADGLDLGPITIGGSFALVTGGPITNSQPVVVAGATTITAGGGNDITLANAGNDFASLGIVSGRNVTVVDKNAIVIAGATVSGTLVLTTNGAITQTAAITVTGVTTLAAGAANDITLTNAGNDFNTMTVTSGNTVSLVDANAMTLTSASTGALNVTVGTDLLVTGTAASASTITINAGQNVTANGGSTLQATGTIGIQFGAANTGATADLRNANILATSTTVTGGTGNDTFRVTGYTTPVTLDGKAPTATATGDTLEFFAENKDVIATPNSFNTAGATVTYLDMETVRLLNPAAITLSGTNGNDVLTLTRTPSGPLQYQFTGLVAVEAIGATSFRFNGLDGSDTLITRFAAGSPIPAGGVTYDGGNGTDFLCVIGSNNVATYTTTAGSGIAGQVTVDGQPINFSNLETSSQVDITGMSSVNVGFFTANDIVDINTGFDVTAGGTKPALILSGPAMTKVGVWKNANLTLDTTTVDGNDSITVTNANNNHLNTNVTIRTGTGADSVSVNGPVAVSGNLLIDSQAVNIAAVAVNAGQNITVNNAQTLTMAAASITAGGTFVQGNGGPVVFSGGIATVNAAAIRFTGTLNGPGGLTANTAGDTLFEQTIGATTPLSSLITDAPGTTHINGAMVKTSSVQTFNDVVIYSPQNMQFLATGGTITFNNTVDGTTKDINLTVGGPNTDVTFTKALPSIATSTLNTFTIVDARNATFASTVTAVTVQQLAGSGQTTFNGAVTATASTGVTNYTVGGAINLRTNSVVIAADMTAANAPIVLQLANGVTQTGGALTTTKLYLTGAGSFQLNQPGNKLTDGSAELFADLTGGEIRVWDSTPLFIAFETPSRTAIKVGGNGNVTLTTNGSFSAFDPLAVNDIKTNAPIVDPSKLVKMFDVGTGTVQVYLGVGLAKTASTAVTFIAEAIASQVILGRGGIGDGNPLNNISKDAFSVRPMLGAKLVVNGNSPVITDGGAFAPFDSMKPQFIGISNANFTPGASGDGTYTFPGTTFQSLSFTSIENLGGIRGEAFTVETAPRVGVPDNAFAVRVQLTQLSTDASTIGVNLNTNLQGNGLVTNPFVVTPVTGSSTTRYGAPKVTMADINGDVTPDLIIANGAGDTPLITIVNGARLVQIDAQGNVVSLDLGDLKPSDLIAQFFPFEPSFRGGINVSTGDFNNDGKSEIVASAGVGGGPRVTVFGVDSTKTDPFNNVAQFRPDLFNFFPFEASLRSGVNVAVGDVNGDGVADIVAGAGVGGGPRVRVYDGKTGNTLRDFFAYDPNFRGGVSVDVGRYDADSIADLVTAPGPGGGPHIQVFLGSSLSGQLFTQPLVGFFAFDLPNGLVQNQAGIDGFYSGVGNVAFGASQDTNGGNRSILVTSPRGTGFSIVRFDRQTQDDKGNPLPASAPPKKTNANYQQTLAGAFVNGVIVPTDSITGLLFVSLHDGGFVGGFSASTTATI